MTTALPLAVQLYSFRDESLRGSEQFTLDRGLFDELARLGYGGVETVGVPGGDVAAARDALAQAGLAVTSTHSWASIDDADGFDRVCADAAALGSPRVIVSGGHFQTRTRLPASPTRSTPVRRSRRGTGSGSGSTTTTSRCTTSRAPDRPTP